MISAAMRGIGAAFAVAVACIGAGCGSPGPSVADVSPEEVEAAFLELVTQEDLTFHAEYDARIGARGLEGEFSTDQEVDVAGSDYHTIGVSQNTTPGGPPEPVRYEEIGVDGRTFLRIGDDPWEDATAMARVGPVAPPPNLFVRLEPGDVEYVGVDERGLHELDIGPWLLGELLDPFGPSADPFNGNGGSRRTRVFVTDDGTPRFLEVSFAFPRPGAGPREGTVAGELSRFGEPVTIERPPVAP